ncbi:MAG: VOC family protein [Gammaproteobacteria bacterium]
MRGINGIHHIGMSVPDLARARAFYVEQLGLEELGAGQWRDSAEIDAIMGLAGSAGKSMFLRANNLYIEMFEFSAPAAAPLDPDRPVVNYGYTHLCIDVTGVLEVHARLAAAGVRFNCAPVTTHGVRTVYGRDPFGNVIELQEILQEGAVQRLPGA